MAQNLELKAKVNSHESFKKILSAIGAEEKGILNQRDVYFTFPKGLLKLRKVNDDYQLIKYVRDESADKRFSDYELLHISSDNAESFLSSVLNVEAVVEKKRELHLYKNTRIHLDDVEGLGKFIELETVVDEKGQQNAEERYWEIFDLLNLNAYKEIRGSYRNLIAEK